jgi:serine/threonine-protein kinase
MPDPFSKERWRQLGPLFDRLQDAAPAERATLLAELEAHESDLAADLRSLIDEHETLQGERFLERPLAGGLAAASLSGHAVGSYTLRSEIGVGGMGSVWLAERTDGRFSGQVAVKLLNASRLGSQGEARFRREGSILARLSHPHVARLLDAGISASGQPYLVLEHVEGQRIDAYCDTRRLTLEARLMLFLDVLAAVAHAHSHLIVHRDLKPSNLLVTSDGTVKLLDFGIAKLVEPEQGLDEGAALTRDGESLLTPEFAAPEQLRGIAVTTRTDVYALGVLLHQLASGLHPRAGLSSPAELIRAVVESEAMRLSEAVAQLARADASRLAAIAERRTTTPRRLQADLRGDLDNIVAKALKLDPSERYASVEALAEDLRRHLRHQPVGARPDSLGYRTAKFVRRHRTGVQLATLAALALSAGVVGTVTQARRATREAKVAEEHSARADVEAARAARHRDFAVRQLARAQAVNELNVYLTTEAAPLGKAFTVGELLRRAEETVRRQHGEGDDTKVELLIQIGEQYEFRDDVVKARQVLEEAFALAKQVPEPSTRARAACALADALRMQGDNGSAARLLAEGASLLPAEPQYNMYRFFCLVSASQLAAQLGETEEAVLRAEEAQRQAQSSPMRSLLLDLDASMQLAEAYRGVGRFQEAAKAHAETFRLLEDLGRGDTERAATVLNNWALVTSALGQQVEAERLYRRALRIASTDAGTRGVSPQLVNNLARILRELDRPREAARLAGEALASARRNGDATMQRRALLVQASAYRLAGDLDRSQRAMAALLERMQREEAPGHIVVANVTGERAMLALARGDGAAAADLADRAVSLAEPNDQRVEHLPRLLLRRAEVQLALGHPDRSQADARRALEMWEANLGRDVLSGWYGLAHLALGQAALAQGRNEEARAEGSQALRHLRPCLGPEHSATRAAERLAGQEFVKR